MKPICVIVILLILSSGILIIPSIYAVHGIPSWIKNNAKWWSTGQIEDSDFIKEIQWLLQNKIIVISQNVSNQLSAKENVVPSWIKNNAGLWADNKISDDEFIRGIQNLVQDGIIHLDQQTSTVKTFASTTNDDKTLFQYCIKFRDSLYQKYNITVTHISKPGEAFFEYNVTRASVNQIMQDNSTNSNVLEAKYQLLTLIGEDQKALPVADKLVSLWSGQEGEEHFYMDQKAILLIRFGQYEEANVLIDEASKRDTYDAPTPSYDYQLKMIIAEKQGNHDLANTYFELYKTSYHLPQSYQDKLDFNTVKIYALSLIGDSKEVLKNIDNASLDPNLMLSAKITACTQVFNTYNYHHAIS